ncbi:MAG: DUF4178 domain-containing protein [Bacteroidales bacterium]
MGIFDIFRKKNNESHYDVNDIRINDLAKGFVFDYNLETWLVVEEYVYDWGHNCFSKEFKISNGTETRYLSFEEDDELLICLSQKISVRSIQSNIPAYIGENDCPPEKIEFEGVNYYLDEESPGYFQTVGDGDDDWDELISWGYYDKEMTKSLCIEQWDDRSFEASKGLMLKEFEITNILPGS